MIVVACMVTAIWLYPFDCDAAFAVHDAIWYGIDAQQAPRGSVNPHHPLFHGLVYAALLPLRALSVAEPGHVATRVIAGLGGLWLLVQICCAAGRNRLLVGAAFALVMFVSRGFVVEMASGENVLPATAAALFAVTLAARPGSNVVVTACALALALLLRQDNIFLIPGVVVAIVASRPSGARVRPAIVLLGIAGIITIAGYAVAWWVNSGGHETPLSWLLRFGKDGPWTGPKHFTLERMPVYLSTIAVAMTGRLWPVPDDQPILGVGYIAAFLVIGVMLRGTKPNVRIVWPIALTLLLRALFHVWYEADNYEWLVLPVAFVVAFAAGLARGEPATPLPLRRVAVMLIMGLAAWIAGSHAYDTWKLRERTLMEAIKDAVDVDRSQWRFIVDGARVGSGLAILKIPYHDLSPRGTQAASMLERLSNELATHPVPTIVIADRFVMDGMPHTARNEWPWAVDTIDLPGFDILRRHGRAYAARWAPPSTEGPPASRLGGK